jgi:hypothetical protein
MRENYHTGRTYRDCLELTYQKGMTPQTHRPTGGWGYQQMHITQGKPNPVFYPSCTRETLQMWT